MIGISSQNSGRGSHGVDPVEETARLRQWRPDNGPLR